MFSFSWFCFCCCSCLYCRSWSSSFLMIAVAYPLIEAISVVLCRVFSSTYFAFNTLSAPAFKLNCVFAFVSDGIVFFVLLVFWHFFLLILLLSSCHRCYSTTCCLLSLLLVWVCLSVFLFVSSCWCSCCCHRLYG